MNRKKLVKKNKLSKAWPTSLVKIHWTHFMAVGLLALYFIVSKVNLAHAFLKDDLISTFIQLFIFGTVFSFLFLYIFSHEKFFPVAKEIEKEEEKKEKKYLAKYIHHGKILATFLIGVIGGPVFSSLTARLLINNLWYKYMVVVFANIPSTFITVAIAKGVIHFL